MSSNDLPANYHAERAWHGALKKGGLFPASAGPSLLPANVILPGIVTHPLATQVQPGQNAPSGFHSMFGR